MAFNRSKEQITSGKSTTWLLNKSLISNGIKLHVDSITIYDDYLGPTFMPDTTASLSPPNRDESEVKQPESESTTLRSGQTQIMPMSQFVLLKSDDEHPLSDSSKLTSSSSLQLTDSKNLYDSDLSKQGSSNHGDKSLIESNFFTMIVPTPIPLAQRPESDYEKVSENISESFHNIYQMRKRKSKHKHRSLYFFKQDKLTPIDPNMYELESTTCSFYRLIAPHHAPKSGKTIYDSSFNKIGVLMKAVSGFKSTLQDPLRESDFQIDVLKDMTIDDLDAIDERARREGLDLENKPDSKIICEVFLTNQDASNPVKNSIRKIQVTAKDLKNFRIMKGLGIGLTTSYIFEEDDCHTGNMSKDGKRIDFDMSPWPMTYKFKSIGPLDWTFRAPGNRFNVTARDILNFPILTDAAPWYWPTTPARYFPESFIRAASKFFRVSQNAFQSADNAIYQKLAANPVFIHYKFTTLLKYILSGPDIYRSLSQLHISDEKNIEMMAKHQAERMQLIRAELLKLPQFHDFLVKHGDSVLKKILSEFAEHNAKFAKKIDQNPLYKLQIINTENIIKEYVEICGKTKIQKNIETLKSDVEISDLLSDNTRVLNTGLK
jgi:hypothetical protein